MSSTASQSVHEDGHQGHFQPTGPTGLAAGISAGMELRHGYTLDSLTRMAHFAARHCKPWHRGIELSARYEVAWSAIAEYLYAAEERPTSADLVRAAWEAIRHQADSRRQFLGLAHDGPDGPGRNFERYWRAVAGPADGPEERLIERLALAQIWPHLTQANRDALTALAVHGDYQRAAVALGISYKAFVSRISEGRRQFLALWHDGETPSRPWVRDRRAGPGTDKHTVTYFLRLRRQRRAASSPQS